MLKGKSVPKKSGTFSKIAVIICFVSAFIFAAAMVVVFLIKDNVPDTLIVSFYTFISAEGGALALIKVMKTKHGKEPPEDYEEVDIQ